MDRIGPYVVERELGRQGIAMLYAVRRDGSGPLEILRRLHSRRATDPLSRLRFERETTLAQELNSPYLVRVEDRGVADDDVPYSVLEFFEGLVFGGGERLADFRGERCSRDQMYHLRFQRHILLVEYLSRAEILPGDLHCQRKLQFSGIIECRLTQRPFVEMHYLTGEPAVRIRAFGQPEVSSVLNFFLHCLCQLELDASAKRF